MGNHVLILKGMTLCSAMPAAAVKDVHLFIPCTVLCGLGAILTGGKVMCAYKLITLQ